jgi:DNA-binding CsgD family transcriptional regulator/PAS domain-containing protein
VTLATDDHVVELIYATAVDPSLWPAAMTALADRLGGARAAITRFDVATTAGEQMAARADPDALAAYAAYYHSVNVFARRKDPGAFLRGWRPHVATECSVVAWEDYQRSEFCNDYVRPQGYNAQLFLRLHLEGQMATTLNIGRAPSRGRFETADLELANRFLPHLVRAHRMGRTFAGAGTDLAAVVQASDVPMVVVDEGGRVRFVNASAERLVRQKRGLSIHGGRVAARPGEPARRLDQLIFAATRSDAARAAGAMSLPATEGGQPLALKVQPLGLGAFPVLGRIGLAGVSVTDPEAELRAPEDELRAIFALTQAEARLAAAVFDGLSLPEAAERFGVSVNTVRFQLARVFDKTGVTRQAELVKLMMRLAGPARLQ